MEPEAAELLAEIWRLEIQRRLAEIDAGTVEMIPWPAALERLKDRLLR